MTSILVVDDRAVDREFLSTLLGYYGYRVLEASDGAEALQVAQDEHPDLIISDVLMPTMDGYAFVQRLRADASLNDTPVIFYTADYLEREALALARACGVSHLLVKPCDPTVVLHTVAALLPPAAAEPPTATESLAVGPEPDPDPSAGGGARTDLSSIDRRLIALVDFRRQLASEYELERLLEGFCRAARDLIGARLAMAGTLGEDPGTLRHFAANGLPPEARSQLQSPPARQGLLGRLLKDRQIQRLHAPAAGLRDLDFLPSGLLPVYSLLAVPIVSPRRVYGWLCLIDKLGVEAFSASDELLATTLATEVAMAYENAMLYTALQRYTDQLEREVTERQRAEATSQESAVRLAALSRRLLEVQENERRHMARELHDEIGQLLTGLKLLLESCLHLPDDARHTHLRQSQALVSELIAQVRNMSLHLRPPMLDDFGLVPTLLWHLERYSERTHLQVSFEHDGLPGRFAPEVETVAFRIIQEALTNVARHAGVDTAAVRLWVQDDTLAVRVKDDGRGFDLEAMLGAGQTSGLAGMRERARLVGGQLVVIAVPGGGTCVQAELPLYPSAAAPARMMEGHP